MINIQINGPFLGIDPAEIEKAVYAVLHHQSITEPLELSVVITDDAELRELNRQFRGIDSATDVLSFPSDETDPESGQRYLGDIIISFSRATEQAQAAGHPVNSELNLLIVHGMLHLLGFDHLKEEEKTKMWSFQAQILSGLGNQVIYPPE